MTEIVISNYSDQVCVCGEIMRAEPVDKEMSLKVDRMVFIIY